MTEEMTDERLVIHTDSDPILRQISAPIEEITESIKTLVRQMFITMYAAPGVGLSAIQVGEPIRLIVYDATGQEARRPVVMINPVIIWKKKTLVEMNEGCLSFPGKRAMISRPTDIEVTYTDLDGNFLKKSLGGLPARIVQHEIDHLDGILISDGGHILR